MSQTVSSSDRLDIGAARRLLDEDHYALDKLKRRVLEYLAVRQLKTSLKVLPPSTPRKGRRPPTPGPPFSTCGGVLRDAACVLQGPILCFVGPPGVGKTSVGRSIARTLGREFHRIALGGVCDQSDIRGHR